MAFSYPFTGIGVGRRFNHGGCIAAFYVDAAKYKDTDYKQLNAHFLLKTLILKYDLIINHLSVYGIGIT